jgi:hypothetical protein
VQHGPRDAPALQEVGDQQQVGDQLTAGVVRDQAERARAGRRQQRPQPRTVVGDQGRYGVGAGRLGRGEAEAEVGAVAPQGAVQQGAVLVVGGQRVERGQFRVRLGGVEFRELERPERVDATPGAGAEVPGGFEQLAVKLTCSSG